MQSLLQPYIRWTEMHVPWKVQQLGAGVWGLWSNPRVRAAIDCRETDRGEMKEETVGGMPVEESQAAMEARQYC